MTRSFSLILLSFALGCAGAQGADPDLNTKDAGKDTKPGKDTNTSEIEEPDTAVDDTGTDTNVDDTAIDDTGTDTGPDTAGCTGGDTEPNDDMSSAIGLTGISDCDGPIKSINGILSSSSDIDWYKFAGSDTIGCSVDPTMLGPTTMRLCVFAKCTAGTSTTFNSCVKGLKTTVGGIDGCCGDGGAQLDYTCPAFGTDDSATIWMSVDTKTTGTCMPYTVTYHF